MRVFITFVIVLALAAELNIFSGHMMALMNNVSVSWHEVGASAIVLQSSLIRSRRHPDNGIGFRVPGGRLGLWLNLAMPAGTWLVLLALTGREHWKMGAGALLVGPVCYLLTARQRSRRG